MLFLVRLSLRLLFIEAYGDNRLLQSLSGHMLKSAFLFESLYQSDNHTNASELMQIAFLQSYKDKLFKMAFLSTLSDRVKFLGELSRIYVEELINVLTLKEGLKDFNKFIRNYIKQCLHYHLKSMYNFINQVNPDKFEENRLIVTNLLFDFDHYRKLIEFIQPACLNDLMPCVQIQERQYNMLVQIGRQNQNIQALILSMTELTRQNRQGCKVQKLMQLRRRVIQFLPKERQNIDGITHVLKVIIEYTYTERHLGMFTLMQIILSCKFSSGNQSWTDEFMMARNSFFSAMAVQYFALKEYQSFFDDKRRQPFLLEQQNFDFQ